MSSLPPKPVYSYPVWWLLPNVGFWRCCVILTDRVVCQKTNANVPQPCIHCVAWKKRIQFLLWMNSGNYRQNTFNNSYNLILFSELTLHSPTAVLGITAGNTQDFETISNHSRFYVRITATRTIIINSGIYGKSTDRCQGCESHIQLHKDLYQISFPNCAISQDKEQLYLCHSSE